jgi:cell division septum initiation protein DivIVA
LILKYVTIEGTVEDVHKDLEKFIIENDQLKQEVELLKEQLQQVHTKVERHKEIINLFKIAFANGDAEHRSMNGRSVQAMVLIEKLEGEG